MEYLQNDYLRQNFNHFNASNTSSIIDSTTDLIIKSVNSSTLTIFDDPVEPEISEIPKSFKEMSDLSRNCVIAYGILFIMSATGNISVFCSVLRQLRHFKSRITLLILNLAIADLLVTFIVMPMEIVWRLTIQWYGGDLLCKICQFCRAFGLYLSSMVVICVSLDRYFAIIYPMKLAGAEKRVKTTLVCAWIFAVIFASPQVVVFKVMPHPQYPSFRQCVTVTFLASDVEEELMYTVFHVCVLYFIPLLVIIFTYFRIILKIYRKSRKHPGETISVSLVSKKVPVIDIDNDDDSMRTDPPTKESEAQETNRQQNSENVGGQGKGKQKIKLFLRRSNGGGVIMARARIRTLRLTCIILMTFVFCWTPYVVMTLWYVVDRDGAKAVDSRIQEGLFIMAVSNSVVNPLIYGTYGSDCSCRNTGIKYSYKGQPYYTSGNNRLVNGNCNRYPNRGSTIGGTNTSVIISHV